jgi:hypothetical protein
MKYWEIIADKLSKAGWSWGCSSQIDLTGRVLFTADVHRHDESDSCSHACQKRSRKILYGSWDATIGRVALNNCQRRKFSPKHFLTRRFQPSIQHGSVNAAKIRVEFQVAVVKFDKTRILAK